jgi:Arc/MetJ family transcription regulator
MVRQTRDLGALIRPSVVRRICNDWCIVRSMVRITVEINDDYLHAASALLGTKTKVATINEALRLQAVRARAGEIIAALDGADMDFSSSADSFRFGGGRDLSSPEDDARGSRVA